MPCGRVTPGILQLQTTRKKRSKLQMQFGSSPGHFLGRNKCTPSRVDSRPSKQHPLTAARSPLPAGEGLGVRSRGLSPNQTTSVPARESATESADQILRAPFILHPSAFILFLSSLPRGLSPIQTASVTKCVDSRAPASIDLSVWLQVQKYQPRSIGP